MSPIKRTELFDNFIFGAIVLYCLTFLFSISISQIAIFTAIGLWLIKNGLNKSYSFLNFPLWPAFAAFAGACLVSAVFAVHPLIALEGERILFHILIFFLVVNQIKGLRQVNLLLQVILFAAFVASCVGVYQSIEGGINLSNRAHGTLSTYMTFAGLLMLVFVYNSSRLLGNKFDKIQLIEWFFLVGIGVGIILSLTRNAWVGLFFGILFLIFMKWKWKAFIFPIVLVISILFLPQTVQERFTSIFSLKNQTNVERFTLWKNGLEMIKDYPVLGVGHDNFQHLYKQYKKPEDRFLGHMHNIYLTFLSEYGVMGLGAWLFLVFSLCRYYTTRLKEDIAEDERSIIHGALGAFIALLTAGFFEPNFNDTEINMFCYFIMALPFALKINNNCALKQHENRFNE